MKYLGVVRLSSLAFAGLACMAAAQSPQSTGILDSSKLYLRTATVDTATLPNAATDKPAVFQPGATYVLQLDGPLNPQRRLALVDTGVALGSYIPQYAYLVDLTHVLPGKVADLNFVRWVGLYEDAWKLDPEIGRRGEPYQTPERIAISAQGRLKLVVSLFEGRSLEQARVDLAALGAEVIDGHVVGGQAILDIIIDKGLLQLLSRKPYVQFIEDAPELTLRNSTTRWIVQSNVTNVTPLYTHGLTGVGQIVGIMDSKVDVNHCSFDDTVPIGPNHRKIAAYNTSLGVSDHGTHVAGTAVGDHFVFDNTRGVAFGGRFVFHDVPSFNESAMVSRLTTHHNQGARIHTNSWGNDGTTAYDSLCRGIDVFSRNFEDDLVLFAVTNLGSLKNPENAKNLLAVGASQDTPSQGAHCSGGTGPTTPDGRRKPEIYAPGCSSISANGGTECGIIAMTGTSMASPAVAGVAMLVRQYFVEGYYPKGFADSADAFTPSGALIKATLLNSAVDMTGIAGYPSNQEGWGRVLADDSLFFDGDARKLIVAADVRNAVGLSTNEAASYPFYVLSAAQKLKVTLVWTDVAAAAGAGFAPINDLDLEVNSPASDLYRGNVFSGGLSVVGGVKDDRNNVEQVHLNAPAEGVWTIQVRGAAVNQGNQGYALVVTGDVADGTCSDGLLNQSEIRIDCGGPCPACQCVTDSACDDGAYCSGVETCDPYGVCVAGTGPCTDPVLPMCNEDANRCVFCLADSDCADGEFCNGPEVCNAQGNCQPGNQPCTNPDQPYCNEADDRCDECVSDPGCDDMLFCTGVETCDALGVCQPGVSPCTDPELPLCNEAAARCDQCLADMDCDDSDTCTADGCNTAAGACEHVPLTIRYADINRSGVVDLVDILCVLDGFNSQGACLGGDVQPCEGDGLIDLNDVLAVLDAFVGTNACSDPCP